MHLVTRPVLLMFLILCVSACGRSNVGAPRGSAWGNYDYRHPVPASSGLSSSAPAYQDYNNSYYYHDNDEYYTPPSNFGCSTDNIHLCQ